MSQLEPILENPVSIIGSFFICIFAIQKIAELIEWIKGKMDGYARDTTEEKDLKAEVSSITCVSQEHAKTLEELTKAIERMNENINARLDKLEEETKENFVISDRATVYQLYKDFCDKDELTTAESECFDSVAQRYIKNGGNGAFRNHIIPFINSKPVKME